MGTPLMWLGWPWAGNPRGWMRPIVWAWSRLFRVVGDPGHLISGRSGLAAALAAALALAATAAALVAASRPTAHERRRPDRGDRLVPPFRPTPPSRSGEDR
jgi:hypothetical protein